MASIALGSLFFAGIAPRLRARAIYIPAIGAIVALNLISILAPEVHWLFATRAPAGLALGAVVATSMAIAGRSDKPEMTFGVVNASVGLMGIVIAFILPRSLGLHETLPVAQVASELDGLYLTYALMSVAALLFLRALPVVPPVEPPQAGAPVVSVPRTGWLALFGLGLIFLGHGSLALFLVTIGRAVPLSPETIGYVFMAGGVVGIVAPLVAGYVGGRFAAMAPVMAVLATLAVFAVLLAHADTPMKFFVAGPVFAMLPMAMMPIVLGVLARIDQSGRLTGSHPAFVLIGGAVAPFVGGAISDLGGFQANGWFAVGCIVLGAALLVDAIRRSDRMR
jgi:predicted MFS family arabinose efflux permease